MELKIIVPTKNGEYSEIIKQWFSLLKGDFDLYTNLDIEVIIEKGLPPSGWDVRQKYTDLLQNEDCWVTFMDDDTLIPREVISDLFSEEYPHESIICYGQRWWSGGPKRLNASPENMHPCRCDVGQFFFHASFLKDMTWTEDYINDGIFYEEMFKRHSKHFIFRNDINTYYNALSVGKGLYNGQIIEIA
jgi:hypothetical protein